MSSSQARLLTLTSRLHSIEHKAQKLEAEKLRLANDSDKVYETYLRALDATKIQYSCLQQDGTLTFRDASLNALENRLAGVTGDTTSTTPFFLQTQDGKIIVTPTIAAKYGLKDSGNETRDLDTFVHETTGKNKSTRPVFRQEPIYRTEAVMGERYVDDTSVILDFTKVANVVNSTPTRSTSFAPVENSSALNIANDCNKFQNVVTPRNTSGLTEITSATTTLTAGQTYTIKTAEGLMQFASIANSSNTAGSTIILASDIDMSGKTWSGISNFAGTFDGNGHIITKLGQGGGTATNGLFTSTTSSAVVQNVGVRNANIVGSSSTAGIVGNNYGKILNCFVQGDISGSSWVGGIVGQNNTGSQVQNCNADINIVATSSCIGGISGHNDGDILHCNSNGSINASSAGGLVGHNTGSTTIKDCITTVQMTGSYSVGAVIGWGSSSNCTIENVVYDPTLNPTKNICGDSTYTGSSGAFKTMVTTPSVSTSDYTGGFYSNIVGALVKAGVDYDTMDKNKVKNYVKNLYNSTDGDMKIANINDYLYKYMTGVDTTGGAFITALQNDINNGSITETSDSAYQNIYSTTTHYANIPTDTSDSWEPLGPIIKGSITIPSVQTIGNQLYYALKKSGNEVDQAAINSWLAQYNTSDATDKQYLANLNNDIQSGSNMGHIKNMIDSNTKYICTVMYDPAEYDITIGGNTTITPTYGKKKEWQDSGLTKQVLDHYEDVFDHNEEYWDTTDPDIANAIGMYAMAKRGVKVVTDVQAASKEYLVNMINAGEAVLTTFDPSQVAALASLTAAEINALSDEEYEKLMGIKNTSVSVETSVMEVQDTQNLKKAEAQYEADMKKIDRKDAQYDTQIAKCENERSAIKEEIETLKNVAKENVDRTFKLFS